MLAASSEKISSSSAGVGAMERKEVAGVNQCSVYNTAVEAEGQNKEAGHSGSNFGGSVLELMFIGSFPIGAAVSPDYGPWRRTACV